MKQSNSSTSPLRIGFLLLNNFTMISLSSAIDPLRMANQLSSQELYQWSTLSEDGEPVASSDNIKVSADFSIMEPIEFDTLIVAGGIDITHNYTPKQLQWLKQLDRKGVQLGSVCTGAYALAAAGLLDGYDCSAHWECLAAITENFPKVNNNNRLYSLSKQRLTCSGGIVPLDMMLALIHQQHGSELVAAISDMFVYDRVRSDGDYQRVPMRHSLGTTQPKLVELVTLMETNLEEPIQLDELASYVDISRRQLERLFQKHLSCTPSRYYLKLRLARARQLLKQTSLSIIEIAAACGFVSTPHFSKCYRDYMGIPPREERAKTQADENTAYESNSSGTSDNKHADTTNSAVNEPSYGSVIIPK